MDAFFPWEIANLVSGPVRVVIAPIAADSTPAVPVKIQDTVGMVHPYTVVTPYRNFGATVGSPGYSRGIETEGWTINEEDGSIMEEVSDTPRSFTVPMVELSAENLMLLENASEIETVAAAANTGAQKTIGMDSIDELTEYRIAFIGRRKKRSGLVTEPGGRTRGRLIGALCNRCTLAAEEASLQFEKGSPVAGDITFNLFPEPGLTEEVYGRWALEDAGTITAS